MTGMREIRKYSRGYMWVEGKTEDTTRIMEGQHLKAIPDHFHSRKCIYLVVSIKAWPRQGILPLELAVTHLKVSCQKKKLKIKKFLKRRSFITGQLGIHSPQ